jgi:hypothetical protein
VAEKGITKKLHNSKKAEIASVFLIISQSNRFKNTANLLSRRNFPGKGLADSGQNFSTVMALPCLAPDQDFLLA